MQKEASQVVGKGAAWQGDPGQAGLPGPIYFLL